MHDEKSSHDTDAGFATVEESSIGKKEINRGMSNRYRHEFLSWNGIDSIDLRQYWQLKVGSVKKN